MAQRAQQVVTAHGQLGLLFLGGWDCVERKQKQFRLFLGSIDTEPSAFSASFRVIRVK
jgi:hypothetical protein